MAKHTAPHADNTVHESAMDYAEHERTYEIFLGLLKWSTIITAVVVVILYFIILH